MLRNGRVMTAGRLASAVSGGGFWDWPVRFLLCNKFTNIFLLYSIRYIQYFLLLELFRWAKSRWWAWPIGGYMANECLDVPLTTLWHLQGSRYEYHDTTYSNVQKGLQTKRSQQKQMKDKFNRIANWKPNKKVTVPDKACYVTFCTQSMVYKQFRNRLPFPLEQLKCEFNNNHYTWTTYRCPCENALRRVFCLISLDLVVRSFRFCAHIKAGKWWVRQ